jgi:hypothetical protein
MVKPMGLAADQTCPHCGVQAGVEEDGDEFRCLVCGGPRIVIDVEIERPGGDTPHLQEAKRLKRSSAFWAIGGTALGGVTAVSAATALLFYLLANPGLVASAGLAIVVAIPLMLSLYAWSKAKSLTGQVQSELANARRIAVSEVLTARPGIEAPELSKIFRTSEDAALQLIAEAQVDSMLRAPEPRYRVGVTGDPNEEIDEEASTVAQPVVRR